MRWFRLHRRWGSCFALIALVFQLGLVSGHVHLDHDAPRADDITVAATAVVGPQAPSDTQTPDRDQCATCALIHLAQTLLRSDAPVLPRPVAFGHPPLHIIAVALTASHPALFRARAPPIA